MKRLILCVFIFLVLCTLLVVRCSKSQEEGRTQKDYQEDIEKSRRDQRKGDTYESFQQLIDHEKDGYEIEYHAEGGSDLLIFSPHGGEIEPGTSEIVEAFNERYSTYLFEGTKKENNRDLHMTSTKFDEPILTQMIKTYAFSISVHGYASDKRHTLVGGTDRKMAKSMAESLEKHGFSAEFVQEGERLSGTDPKNINNRNASGESVQLEISMGQRKVFFQDFDIRKDQKKAFKTYVSALKEVIRKYDHS
ncbi:poly-gamma-glutamate hydrolase family protein [Bacillus sp. NPDC077027]|uniref:poly-gamma-glutamate hydrolase family protein n=1 Tax=Bacillus sp. NPDC077027 TaxID=3390548 RepID=UPI003D08A7AE